MRTLVMLLLVASIGSLPRSSYAGVRRNCRAACAALVARQCPRLTALNERRRCRHAIVGECRHAMYRDRTG